MSYTSVIFLIFVTIAVILYFCFSKSKNQWLILLIASYVFYCFASPKFLAFIVFTTITVWISGIWMNRISVRSKTILREHKEEWDKEDKKRHKAKSQKKMRGILVVSLLLNFGILFVLKYYNFFAVSFNHFGLNLRTFSFLLPLGISFYTFQSLGYLIDVYRGDITAEKNLLKFSLFVSFFPQIIQGPISRYDQLAEQLYKNHNFNWTSLKYGCELILWGFIKKLVISERLITWVSPIVENYQTCNGTTLSFVAIIYSIQVYADFSAGIDISRGVAQILGIDMIQNFRQPYFSKTLAEFWNRWHISLGAWMKSYVFYPLALSSVSKKSMKVVKKTWIGKTKYGSYFSDVFPGAFATTIVFIIVGLWHGANWTFIFYGLYNGVIMSVSMLLAPLFSYINRILHINVQSFSHKLFQIARTFFIVVIGNITDLCSNMQQYFIMIKKIFTQQSLSSGKTQILSAIDSHAIYILIGFLGILMLLVVDLLKEKNTGKSLREIIDTKPVLVEWSLVLSGVILITFLGIWGPNYNPSDFVYMQF